MSKAAHHRLPGHPEFGPAMQQQERLSLAGPRDMETRAIRFDGQMFDPIGIHRRVSIEESAASYKY
jgi:hypothetical protein